MSLKAIAEEAGVSVSTVSRVLNDPEHRCASDEVRREIWRIARQQHYLPNEAARNLKTGKSAAAKRVIYIDILMTRTGPGETDVFFSELFRFIEVETQKSSSIIAAVFHETAFSDDRRCRTEDIDAMIGEMTESAGRQSDGIIVLGKCNEKVLEKLKKKYRAVVSVSRNSVNYVVDEVTADGCRIAGIAVDYLISLGHRRIGYVGDCHRESRYEGYQKALFRHNLTPDISTVIEARHTEAEGYAVMEKLCRLPEPATAIYCATDTIAIGMLKYLHQSKNRYYQPSIIASDDIDAAQFTTPMLTTIHLPKEEMAKQAVQLLLDRISGGHTTAVKVEYDGRLMARQSCASAEESYVLEYYL